MFIVSDVIHLLFNLLSHWFYGFPEPNWDFSVVQKEEGVHISDHQIFLDAHNTNIFNLVSEERACKINVYVKIMM